MDYCVKFNGKIPIELIKEIWIDKENLDLYALYFIGLALSRNNDNGGYSVNVKYDDIDVDVIECSKRVYESLNEYFLENMENVEIIERTTIEKLKRMKL